MSEYGGGSTRAFLDGMSEARRTLEGMTGFERDIRITRVCNEVRKFAPEVADAIAACLRGEAPIRAGEPDGAAMLEQRTPS